MDLTDVEQQLVDSVARGGLLDLSPNVTGDEIDETVMRSWDESHDVRAEVISEILAGRLLPADGPAPRALRLRGAQIVGRINLDNLDSPIKLEFTSCFLPRGVSARDCSIPKIVLHRSMIGSDKNVGDGALVLSGASIAGKFAARGAKIWNESGPALEADELTVGRGVDLFALQAVGGGSQGTISLANSSIGQDLVLSNASIVNRNGPAIRADSTQVGGRVLFDRGFTALGMGSQGVVRCVSARISGSVYFSDSRVISKCGPALCADGLVVGANLVLRGEFKTTGDDLGAAIRLVGTRVMGQLDMTGASLANDSGPSFQADGIKVEGEAFLDQGFTAEGVGPKGTLILKGAKFFGGLTMSGASIKQAEGPTIIGDGLSVEGDVLLNKGFSAIGAGQDGIIRLVDAHITGLFDMSGADLKNSSGPTLHADGITIDGSFYVSGNFVALGDGEWGCIRFVGSQVNGQFVMEGFAVSNASGPAIIADNLSVGKKMSLSRASKVIGWGSAGAVRLAGVRVAEQLVVSDINVENEDGPAILADNIHVGSDAIFDGSFTATKECVQGVLHFPNAYIAGRLKLTDAALSNVGGPLLVADGATIKMDAFLDCDFRVGSRIEEVEVSLPRVNIGGRLIISPNIDEQVKAGVTWAVEGLTYADYPSVGFGKWLNFLRAGTLSYRPQPYQQLVAAARAAGHDKEARQALIAQRNDQIKRGLLPCPSRAWAWFTGVTLGHGYQPWRALIGIALLTGLAYVVTGIPEGYSHVKESSDVGVRPILTPCTWSERLQLAVDMAIPLVSTSGGTTCQIAQTAVGETVSATSVGISVSGWAATALFAAGFTSAVRRPN